MPLTRVNSEVSGSDSLWQRPLDPNRSAAQIVNRITFGARPGDFERVRALGVDRFIDQQLNPERLNDAALESRLATLPTLSMTTSELIEKYPMPKQGEAQQADAMKAAGQDAAMVQDTAREVIVELGREELLRAVYSSRQLQEVMVQFWMNHFNIFAGKGPDKWMLTSFERDTIRPRALGRFEDLLVATAQSPAMQFYLDNWLSSGPSPAETGIAGPFGPRPFNRPNQQRRGLNENYGREVMELHTLGVDGGYTQRDVIEVARCLTGWTLRRPRLEPEFFFDPRLHDSGPKTVLGHYIAPGGGFGDGLQVLHILSTHPATARFISTKLCRRFVADDPPAALVDRVAGEFMRTDGSMPAVLKSILSAPEFYSEAAYRAKMKSPLEVTASALRALGAETDAGMPLLGFMNRMGEPMFQLQAPAGLPDRGNTWTSSSGLLARLNFATTLASNRIRGTEIAWDKVLPREVAASSDGTIDGLSRVLTGSALSQGSLRAIRDGVGRERSTSDGGAEEGPAPVQEEGYPAIAAMAALVIGSPEFQRR
jgi:uncharacterized protein (DUF1800 family)